MCGKFTQMASWQQVHAYLSAFTITPGEAVETCTPMRFASILTLNDQRQPHTRRMRWGFSKLSAASPGKPDHIHARAETIDQKPTFRDAFLKRRGLLMVSSFNEAREITPTKFEQQVITPDDGGPIAIAVLWEGWEHDKGDTLLTFVMVTTPPNALIGTITDRMPAIMRPEDHARWLGEEPATPAELKAMLQPFAGAMTMRPEKPPKARPPQDQASLF